MREVKPMEALILVLLLLPPSLAVVGFWFHLDQLAKKNRVARWRATYIYQPDQQGNYPQYFNPEDPYNRSDLLPGNSPVPDTYLIRDGLQNKLGKPKPSTTINRAGIPYSVTFQQSVDEAHLISDGSGFQPETSLSEPEMIEKLKTLKLRGEKQGEAIFAVTGCKPGGSELYQWAASVWRAIPIEGRILNK